MNSKIPCKKCGVMILPSTAEGTGGICIPCQNGVKKIAKPLTKDSQPWPALLHAFDQVMGLSIPSDNSSGEASCIKIIQELVSKHGYADIYACLKAHDGDDMQCLYWFARAGVSQSIPAIEKHLTSEDITDVFYAAGSLALLNDERGLDIIEKLCAGDHPLTLEETQNWYLDEFIQHIDHPKARELENKYCNQSLSSQDSSTAREISLCTTRPNTMKWEKFIDTKDEQFYRGIVFRFPAQHPFESVVDYMLINDLYSPAEYSLMCSTGHYAGIIELQLPEESMHADGGISVQWLKDNWQKWVYKDCKVEDVKFIEEYWPEIGKQT